MTLNRIPATAAIGRALFASPAPTATHAGKPGADCHAVASNPAFGARPAPCT